MDALIETGQRFVTDHMQVAYQFEPGNVRRKEVPEYSLDAAREALTNAVAHHDHQPAATIQVRIFDDRLELQNPGGLLPGLTLGAILRDGAMRSSPRYSSNGALSKRSASGLCSYANRCANWAPMSRALKRRPRILS